MVIKAPFNFVPVYDKVFFPDWAKSISHDIPFEDGVSGTIKVKITAKSPIFVRNGHTQAEASGKSDACKQFSNVDGKYFIPGTSIKGAVRSVLEIMSFGKMSTQETHKYACKWGDDDYPKPNTLFAGIKTGWLQKDEKGYFIEQCDYARIGHKEIDNYLKSKNFENIFSKKSRNENFQKTTKDKDTQLENGPKTAFYKYNLVRGKKLDGLLFSSVETTYTGIERLKVDERGSIKGTIVFTGQPNQWVFPRPTTLHDAKGAGKFYEFVFLDDGPGKKYELSDEEYDNFVYLNQNNYQWKKEWKANFENHGEKVPVFFRINGNRVANLGLSYLYKLPGAISPDQCIPREHKNEEHDLAECMFGYVSHKKDEPSLKGRVQFGHAWCNNSVESEEKKYVLATPKPSYYPIYVEEGAQWKNGVKLAGRKRYIVRKAPYEVSAGSDAMQTSGLVLSKGAEFTETITFYNLKKAELGALLCALTFDGRADCLHTIGQGKPFGWGSVSIEIDSVNTDVDDIDRKDCVDQFKKSIKFVGNWEGMDSIRELFELAKPIEAKWNNEFSYMNLDNKEFADAKKNKEHLERVRKLRARLNNPVVEKPKTKGPSNAPKTKMSALLKNARRGF